LLSNQKVYFPQPLIRRAQISPLVMLVLAALACNFPRFKTPEKALMGTINGELTSTPGTAISALELPGDGSVTTSAGVKDSGGAAVVLTWRGNLPGEPGAWHALEARDDQSASFGPCGEIPREAIFSPPQWDEIRDHFASFTGEVGGEIIDFQGRGQASGPAWQRALLSWVRQAYTVLYTGQACSACNTVMAWSFGEFSSGDNICTYLWVTDYGYAYAGTVDCQGGQATITSQGWLLTDEWVVLDAWINSRAEVRLGESGASYLLGRGQQAMDETELSLLMEWAHTVQERLNQ
jgi:hypothetical protein